MLPRWLDRDQTSRFPESPTERLIESAGEELLWRDPQYQERPAELLTTNIDEPEPVALRRFAPTSSTHIGRILRRMRDDKRISQMALASQAGVDTSYISKLEGGRVHSPSPAVITRIAEALGVDSELLFSFAGTISPKLAEGITKNPHAHRFAQMLVNAALTDEQWREMFAELARIMDNTSTSGGKK